MNTETFFQQFELLADAPNGIGKLRELILQLAVQGKLVSQNPDDEPAAVLLEKIKAEKERLVKKKEIRKEKPLTCINGEDILYTIPNKWKWTRLGYLVSSYKNSIVDGPFGSRLKASEYIESGVPIIRLQNINRNEFLDKNIKYVTKEKANSLSRHTYRSGDLIITKLGDPAGKACIIPEWQEPGLIVADLIRMRLNKSFVNSIFLMYLINSTTVISQFENQSTGITRQRVNLTKVRELLVPLPPLAEQKRIVKKVDRLMELCDKLEAQQQQQQTKTLQLGTVATSRLTAAKNPDAFKQHWQNISNNFDLIYSTPENIKQLRQTILQLAVMGKLVPQNPDDEPASILLEKIKAEKEKLIKEGKIKKSKKLKAIAPDEISFKIPKGWEYCRIDDIALKVTDGEHLTPKRTERGYYLLSARNIRDEGIVLDKVDYVQLEEFKRIRKRCNPEKNDILISCSGSVGRVAIVDKDNTYVMVRSVALLKPFHDFLYSKYLAYILKSFFVQEQIINKSKASAQANLFLGKIKEIELVIPPLAEQHRIVAKVNQLMTYCDELEAKLTQSLNDKEKLMDTAVYQLLTA